MNYPEYVRVDGKDYKINTDYRVALKCQELSLSNVSDYEKVFGTILLLFGEEGYECPNKEKLLDLALKYLSLNIEDSKSTGKSNKQPDMDFEQDMSLIIASFMSDYHIDITKEQIHWWKFFDLLNGLSEDCVLNRIREIRTTNLNDINDEATKKKLKDAQEQWRLKEKPVVLTEQQQKSVDKFYELTGLKRKGE